jgi:hypothetical protein
MVLASSAAVASTSAARWTIEATPDLPHGGTGVLRSVACPMPTACMAVGAHHARFGHYKTLAERWDGIAWLIVKTPKPPDSTNSFLNDVACPSSTSCIAVGSASGPAIAESWDGIAWSIEPIAVPPGALGTGLNSVVCIGVADCTAVGGYNMPGEPYRPLVEHWDGFAWSLRHAPRPPRQGDAFLTGISCSRDVDCMAVGEIGWRHFHTFIEHWDGKAWTVVPSPEPDGRTYPDTWLLGVSCATSSVCVAVGYSAGDGGGFEIERTFVERWDGSAWSIEPVRLRSGNDASVAALWDVSCSAPTACMAVGGLRSDVLAERWDGTTWTKQTPPSPEGSESALYGVTCSRPAKCVAVGSTVLQVESTLAERYGR